MSAACAVGSGADDTTIEAARDVRLPARPAGEKGRGLGREWTKVDRKFKPNNGSRDRFTIPLWFDRD